MPVRPEKPAKAGGPVTIAEDRPCRFCGYNLRGLNEAGKCPECGRPIRRPREPVRYADQMMHAPLAWLRGYRQGTLLLCIGGWVMALSLLAWALLRHPVFGLGALAGSIAWTLGAVIATRPRPRTRATLINPDIEWLLLRLWVRWSQPVWVLGIGGALLVEVSDVVELYTVIPVGLLILTGVIGWWPLMMIQSNLAYWASDTELAERLRHVGWGAGLGLGLGAGVLFTMGQGWSGGVLGSVLFFSVWAGTMLVSLGYVLVSLWQLYRMAHWATVSHITAELRDERLRERARQAAAPRWG